ncbi:MAG: PQQ-dependent sugar dehydrogenase [Myxococcota bacterium]|nr:PQQ-dependent sugar dehydrogenase [Myxococcota bacterium]
MNRISSRIRKLAAIAPAVLALSCNAVLPEEYAINIPMGALLGWGIEPPPPDEIDTRFEAPHGLGVSLYAEGLPNARILRFTPAGDLLVSTPRSGAVVVLERPASAGGRPAGRRTLIEGLNRPHGIEIHDGWLYIAETDAVGRIRFDVATGTVEGEFERVLEGLPGGGNHWSRTLRAGPDGKFYVSIGSSCNVCIEEDPRRSTILRFDPDGDNPEILATGLRNSVGFDWRPEDGQLYATDNGRDLLGDDFPPEELNLIVEGGFYGWPSANGNRVPDPDFGANRESEIAASIPPAYSFPAHNAPLGITFIRSPTAPAMLRGAALVALHGSWNRTTKDGYKVVSLHWDDAGRISQRDFLTGYLSDDTVIGRPVDVAEGPDGAIYISDDYAGAIWRVAAAEHSVPPATPAQAAVDPPSNSAPGNAARGRQLFDTQGCAGCHDPSRAAPGVVPVPLRELGARYSSDSLVALLLTPPPPMPVVPLSPEQRQDLAAFLLAPTPAPNAEARRTS